MSSSTPEGSQTSLRSSLDWWDYLAVPLTLAAGAAAVYCAYLVKRPPPSNGIYGWWLTAQIVATLIAAGLPAYSAFRAKRRESQAAQREIDVRTQTRIEMNQALDPIVRCLADGAHTPGLGGRVLGMVLTQAAELIGPDHETRSCYFALKPGPPKKLVPTRYRHGRMDKPRSTFVAATEDGDDAIALVEANGHRFCKDTSKDPPPGWNNKEREYRTFISVAVAAADTAYGMITVDALKPGDLEERDVDLLTVMAGLFATATRLTPPRVGPGQ